ncbi:MAG: biopolymer transporter ExbD [Deltaproteobacteria bacterium]|nr:biopolymer transporter ExbD [Deltaproteobacteria bacterium]
MAAFFDNRDDRKGFSLERKLMSDINITPFVDVMLVLLVIFMVTAPILVHGIKVHLPSASARALKAPEKTIVVSVASGRELYINDLRVSPTLLTQKLKVLYKNRRDKQVFLKASSSLPYGYIIRIMAAIKDAGITKIGMVTANLRHIK